MGKALRDGYRQRVFLMTKIDGRTREAAAKQIEESLQRLQTDHIDLLQFHEIIRPDDPEKVFAAGGGIGSDRRSAESGEGALHRVHRAQESGLSFEDAGNGGRNTIFISTPCRCR